MTILSLDKIFHWPHAFTKHYHDRHPHHHSDHRHDHDNDHHHDNHQKHHHHHSRRKHDRPHSTAQDFNPKLLLRIMKLLDDHSRLHACLACVNWYRSGRGLLWRVMYWKESSVHDTHHHHHHHFHLPNPLAMIMHAAPSAGTSATMASTHPSNLVSASSSHHHHNHNHTHSHSHNHHQNSHHHGSHSSATGANGSSSSVTSASSVLSGGPQERIHLVEWLSCEFLPDPATVHVRPVRKLLFSFGKHFSHSHHHHHSSSSNSSKDSHHHDKDGHHHKDVHHHKDGHHHKNDSHGHGHDHDHDHHKGKHPHYPEGNGGMVVPTNPLLIAIASCQSLALLKTLHMKNHYDFEIHLYPVLPALTGLTSLVLTNSMVTIPLDIHRLLDHLTQLVALKIDFKGKVLESSTALLPVQPLHQHTHLRSLWIRGPKIQLNSVFERCPNVMEIWAYGCDIGFSSDPDHHTHWNEALVCLTQHCHHVRSIQIGPPPSSQEGITSQTLQVIANAYPELRSLGLPFLWTESITEQIFHGVGGKGPHLGHFQHLTILHLHGSVGGGGPSRYDTEALSNYLSTDAHHLYYLHALDLQVRALSHDAVDDFFEEPQRPWVCHHLETLFISVIHVSNSIHSRNKHAHPHHHHGDNHKHHDHKHHDHKHHNDRHHHHHNNKHSHGGEKHSPTQHHSDSSRNSPFSTSKTHPSPARTSSSSSSLSSDHRGNGHHHGHGHGHHGGGHRHGGHDHAPGVVPAIIHHHSPTSGSFTIYPTSHLKHLRRVCFHDLSPSALTWSSCKPFIPFMSLETLVVDRENSLELNWIMSLNISQFPKLHRIKIMNSRMCYDDEQHLWNKFKHHCPKVAVSFSETEIGPVAYGDIAVWE